MPTEVSCDRCGEAVYEDSDFCPHCGILREEAGERFCAVHPEAKAGDVCIICHRLLCRSCRKRKGGKSFCADHQQLEVVMDWVNIFQSNDVALVELIRSVLEEERFTVQEQTSDSAESVWGKVLDMPRKIFVPIPEYLRASECVSDWMSQSGRGHREITPDEDA
jgi:hypothetical protein